MICKWRYDKEKHKTLENALDADYRQNYAINRSFQK